ncbi:hypothetical protein CAI21_14710 [Alkalilimnicola ehrlichii]|uniref:DNA 3'-5' helicase n=1 Tax=Alkalilimnicola ehrlichii TaxID=351052 RepID=A0A3E0WPR3_9GAMM|nr:UvrD-helicase domain-containing protein [Alkalilimnicola ehrlichii]RFA27290.1 hypothetical protein CAI21_14710 [Alkalilimnicola ehrlichii]RFA34399.1 hypothetical protein CAL65_15280 [Alkalilimnicola ehrlichii]
MPFEAELEADQSDLVQQVVDDYWRRQLAQAEPPFIAYLLKKQWTPEKLADKLAPHLSRSYAELDGPVGPVDPVVAGEQLRVAWENVREAWQTMRAEVEELLLTDPGLNRRRYALERIPSWLESMAAYLTEAPEDHSCFDEFERFTTSYLADSVKKGHQPPQHPFFALCERLHEAQRDFEQINDKRLAAFVMEGLAYLRHELPVRKRRQRVQAFDDLLANLYGALRGPAAATLTESLRRRYRAALIDEFQDTDPVQYEIFRTVFREAGAPVFLVGDPKQAIYSFRGADVFAYLAAKHDAPERYTLSTNRRSDAPLIAAVNAVFQRPAQPFLLDAIDYEAVDSPPGARPTLTENGNVKPPLQFWFLPGEPAKKGEKARAKGRAEAEIVEAVAGEIARLLQLAQQGKACIGERALEGGDIAVLVRKHYQAEAVRLALQRRGVASVQQSKATVYLSLEADELERLLLAVAEPGRESLLRAAMTTDMLGINGPQLLALGEDETAWNAWVERFHDYHQLWRDQGFMRFFRLFLRREGVAERLLSYRDGERRLTNVQHLAELLQSRATATGDGIEGLLNWFAERRRGRRPTKRPSCAWKATISW